MKHLGKVGYAAIKSRFPTQKNLSKKIWQIEKFVLSLWNSLERDASLLAKLKNMKPIAEETIVTTTSLSDSSLNKNILLDKRTVS